MQRVIVGEYDGTRSERVVALHAALLEAGIKAEISDDIRRTLWEKYVFLVGLSGSTTTMRSTIGPIRENAQTRAFLHDLMKETVAVGRAHGVNLPGDYADQRLAFVDTMAVDMTSSMHHDLNSGNPLEVRLAVWRRRRAGRAGRGPDAGQSGRVGRPRAPCRRPLRSLASRESSAPDHSRASAARPVSVPLNFVLGTSAAAVREAPLLLVDLETNEGITGHAYQFCYRAAAAPAVAASSTTSWRR